MTLLTEVQRLDIKAPTEEQLKDINTNVLGYSLANKGATTEFPQRMARFEAMKSFFEE